MNSFFQMAAIVLACLSALMSITLFIPLSWPAPVLWFLKLFVSALSPVLTSIGALGIIVGIATEAPFLILIGIYNFSIFLFHIIRVSRPPQLSCGFERAFGSDWEKRIGKGYKEYFLPRRMMLTLPSVPDPRIEQNIAFAIIPGTDRKLLCDIWQPSESVTPTGLAFIYVHGSAFYLLDKDCGTRPFFRHLAAQGHVIMDVAHRLSPESDVMGMVNDVKRAIIWMKANAGTYRVDANRIVVGGGSSGGHLSLLAAYTADNPSFTPKEFQGQDVSVCAVISLYGSSDMEGLFYHTNQHLTTRSTGTPKKGVPTKMPGWLIKSMGEDYHRLGFDKALENAGALAPLLGGHPDECPEIYALFSAATHVHTDCPPTFLIHGEHDIMAPVKSTRLLFERLLEKKVAVVMHILPQTDHAFDMILPKISPAAHTAFYDVERFLALQVKTFETSTGTTKQNEELELIH